MGISHTRTLRSRNPSPWLMTLTVKSALYHCRLQRTNYVGIHSTQQTQEEDSEPIKFELLMIQIPYIKKVFSEKLQLFRIS